MTQLLVSRTWLGLMDRVQPYTSWRNLPSNYIMVSWRLLFFGVVPPMRHPHNKACKDRPKFFMVCLLWFIIYRGYRSRGIQPDVTSPSPSTIFLRTTRSCRRRYEWYRHTGLEHVNAASIYHQQCFLPNTQSFITLYSVKKCS